MFTQKRKNYFCDIVATNVHFYTAFERFRLWYMVIEVIEGKIRGKWKWQEDEEEDVRSYWMTLRTGEDILIWMRRLWIALYGGIVLEEALDLSSDRILNEWIWSKIIEHLRRKAFRGFLSSAWNITLKQTVRVAVQSNSIISFFKKQYWNLLHRTDTM